MARQLPLIVWVNQNLFSQNYLQARLPETPIWASAPERAEQAMQAIQTALARTRDVSPGPGDEGLVEDRLIRPVFTALGLHYDVRVAVRGAGRRRYPDYALFGSSQELAEARRTRDDTGQYYRRAVAVGEAKYWGRPLGDTDTRDPVDSRDPTAQIIRYLDDAHFASGGRVNWAILTNGKTWRLFSYRAASRATSYYEVDLEAATARSDLRDFMYFYLFFSQEALIKDPGSGKSWLDWHLEGSEEYAREISSKLKERIFDQVFEHLAAGFLAYRRQILRVRSETEETLNEIFNSCLILLYRLLFVLYAESRNLLPVDDMPRYFRQSLTKLKHDVRDRLQEAGAEGIDPETYEYWERLSDLFRKVHDGSRALNVPRYNGNLFFTDPGSFLSEHRLGDRFLAEAIELLTVDDSVEDVPGRELYFDYSSLGVRHLGDIYEGLLEFRIRVAEEEMVEVGDRGRWIWKRASEHARGYVRTRRRIGEVYIENSKHERRATGSYFTPHDVVEYMMEKTLKPVLGDRFEAAREAIEHCQSLRRRRDQVRNTEDLRDLDKQIADVGQQAFELVFSVRMLDPAMGSGHFLVHGVNVITSNVMTFLGELGDNAISDRIQEMRQAILEDVESQGVRFVERDLAKLAEPNLVKRMVMKRCIFGVDLNPMAVELSKLSLWLDSFTIGAPLSFLDHHLRCGNSLIGVTFEEVESGIGETPRRRARGSQVLLFGSLFAEVFRAAQSMLELGSLTDVTWQEVQDSRRLYDQAKHRLEPFRRALDLWTAEAFGTRGSQGVLTHGGVISHLRDPEHMLLQHRELLRRAEDVAQRHRFFHWEIEFPEVYYERDQRRECPGFDVVIGNPPYVRIQEMESEAEKEWLRSALRGDVPRYISAFRNFDLYVPFIERAFSLCREGGHFCFIVPNKFFQAEYGERLRGILIGRKSLAKIVNFGHNQIFEGSSVTNYTCLLFLTAVPQNHVEYVEILPLDDVHRQLPEVLGLQGNARYLKSEEFLLDELSEEPWCFPVGVERVIQRKAHAAGLPLEDVVEDVIVGIQTSRDDVYILEYRGPSSNANLLSVYSKALDRTIELEKGVLKPLLSGDDVDRYGAPVANKCLLFPYRPNDEGEMELIHAETFRSDYPRTWRYLRENASVLRGRENGKMEGARWYAYVYPKNLDKQERPKLGVPRLVDRLKAFYDKHGQFYLDNVDVNGILFREGRSESHYYCLALINSRLMDYLFRQCSVRFRGDFYSANKQFIVRLPIRRIAFVTPSEVRSEVCTGGFRLVKDAVGAGAMSNILAWVNDRLSPRHSPDPGFAKKYEGDPIWHGWFGQVDGKWEQADVVHDLMAGLGERMEVLSRDIDAERSGFMRWLGQTIRSDLGQIVGLRGLPDYARVTPDELIRVLQTNQKRLQVDVSTRAFAERLATELATSQARLAPLLSEYDATDRLIDAVAYRLYGLDAEEITAIERAESMNATAEVDGYQ